MDAVDDLSDAIDATRELLVPVEAGLWLKLAIVVFFVGGGTGMSGGYSGDLGPVAEDATVDSVAQEIPDEVVAMAAVIVAVVLAVWVLYRLVGAIMEFVFIESLRSMDVRVGRYFVANVGRGLRLFGFRLVVGLLALGLVAGPGLFLVADAPTLEAAADSLGPLLVLGFAVYLVFAIVMRFTSEFVAPIMVLEERGVLGAWSRFWGTLTANWTEYVVYLVLVWILQLVINIAAGFVILFGLLVLAIPFVVLGALVFTLGEIGAWLAAVVGIVGVAAALLFVALVQMPIRTYFQYYALLLLGDTNERLDLLPEQRAEIRADEGADGTAEPDSSGDARRDDARDWDDTGSWTDDSSGWDDTGSWTDDSSGPDDGDGRDEDDRDRGW